MYKDLSHLSDAEIEILIQRYYDGEGATKLIKEYDLSVRATELYKLFPPEVCEDKICEHCGGYLVIERPSKAWKNSPRFTRDMYCPNCNHRPYDSQCNCEKCVKKENEIKLERLAKIKEVYSKEKTPINFSELSFENKVFLGTLCRALCKENLFEITPYTDSKVVLAPTEDFCAQIYRQLANNQIISVSPLSSLEAFDVTTEDFPNTYYIYMVMYYLNLDFPVNKETLFNEILSPTYYAPEVADAALSLWRQIAIAECIEYLEYRLDKVGFNFAAGDKTYKTFDILLNDFSVSQIYGIIWRAVAEASKLYLEKGLTKRHAANSVIGSCQRYAERAKINGWNLTEYNRPQDLPQSELSAFFFNRVLGIGDMGFRLPPMIV